MTIYREAHHGVFDPGKGQKLHSAPDLVGQKMCACNYPRRIPENVARINGGGKLLSISHLAYLRNEMIFAKL